MLSNTTQKGAPCRGTVLLFYSVLQQFNPRLMALLSHLLWPVGGLHLTDVSLAQKEHTHTGLSDTTTDCVGQSPFQKCFVEG
jgi:hypothetical protein